jgi:transposase
MAKHIMVGCDLHDKTMLLKIGVDRDKPTVETWATDPQAVEQMIGHLERWADRIGGAKILFAYEACGFGFRLYDALSAAGIECYVLAPSKMNKSVKHRKRKTDERDAQLILDELKAYVLAGVALPSVWVPDAATRDDRELVRRRLAVAQDGSAAMVRIRWLLKGHGIQLAPANAWTEEYWQWLAELADGGLPAGAAVALGSLMRQVQWLGSEREALDRHVLGLADSPRYASVVAALRRHKGIGVLTAMVFLTELGDLSRFSNRREVGSFLGLVPSCYETGEADDRKGHITCQGPSRVRKVLCQAVWSRLRCEPRERKAYDRIVARNPKHKKKAVVARMRTLAVELWHSGLEAQAALREEVAMA